jgi:hypothetical protein
MEKTQWTVKDLTEALKQFPLDATVYYEMGPMAPGRSGKRNTLRRGVRAIKWECYWTSRISY